MSSWERWKRRSRSCGRGKTGFEIAVSGCVEDMRAGVAKWKPAVDQWTNNIYSIETSLADLASGDRETLKAIRRECCGGLYDEGEGLLEIDIYLLIAFCRQGEKAKRRKGESVCLQASSQESRFVLTASCKFAPTLLYL